jgi:hypothetical protein
MLIRKTSTGSSLDLQFLTVESRIITIYKDDYNLSFKRLFHRRYGGWPQPLGG